MTTRGGSRPYIHGRFCIRSSARISNGHRSALLVVDGEFYLRLGGVGVGATAVWTTVVTFER
jgi:hypothetical protein